MYRIVKILHYEKSIYFMSLYTIGTQSYSKYNASSHKIRNNTVPKVLMWGFRINIVAHRFKLE